MACRLADCLVSLCKGCVICRDQSALYLQSDLWSDPAGQIGSFIKHAEVGLLQQRS